ncbi:MAG: hypothetical protein EOM85_01190 [Candidatus Moranbacteria bacterium]|nr:hypothetical protein [Candidatus Moranbacteria bacterium]
MEKKNTLNQKFLYTLIYGTLGIFAGILEYLFLSLFVFLPIEFIVLTRHYNASYRYIKNLETSFVVIGLIFFTAIVIFLGLYGYKKGRRRDNNKIQKKKWLDLIFIAEFLIAIPVLYFFIEMIALGSM